ncbi:hypothetical protein R6U77_09075 [Lysinibacillus louembei]|uniref:Major facilitator superfamily (MFS) profile domain-containing protein n=1 Tax=Lysinibacillus louembei TaxID=1470088 RepID=A0ABZ0RZV5_9BACI|nr:hypothetical protein [Lysinibacillus louembei]WPK13794.1 hypothetical protein R6U77_09075 [Lysinibacillus louembei]
MSRVSLSTQPFPIDILYKEAYPHERLGLATSTYFILYDTGLGVGPFILGFFVPVIGYSNIFLSMVFVIIAACIFYYFLYGRNEKAISSEA